MSWGLRIYSCINLYLNGRSLYVILNYMITLPKLDYKYEDLEPYIDKQTMELHHSKHHQGYVDKLNAVLAGTGWENKSLEEILKNLDKLPENIRTAVRNNGGGVFNHNLFFESLSPKRMDLLGKIKEGLEKDFGSVELFKEEFGKAALGQFGSGWAWLMSEQGKLKILATGNQDVPLIGKPILALDVWEHAYYLKYQNRRAEYIEAWWQVINWEAVAKKF